MTVTAEPVVLSASEKAMLAPNAKPVPLAPLPMVKLIFAAMPLEVMSIAPLAVKVNRSVPLTLRCSVVAADTVIPPELTDRKKSPVMKRPVLAEVSVPPKASVPWI